MRAVSTTVGRSWPTPVTLPAARPIVWIQFPQALDRLHRSSDLIRMAIGRTRRGSCPKCAGDIALMQRVILDAVRGNRDVLPDPASPVFMASFGDSTLDFEIRAFADALAKRMRPSARSASSGALAARKRHRDPVPAARPAHPLGAGARKRCAEGSTRVVSPSRTS